MFFESFIYSVRLLNRLTGTTKQNFHHDFHCLFKYRHVLATHKGIAGLLIYILATRSSSIRVLYKECQCSKIVIMQNEKWDSLERWLKIKSPSALPLFTHQVWVEAFSMHFRRFKSSHLPTTLLHQLESSCSKPVFFLYAVECRSLLVELYFQLVSRLLYYKHDMFQYGNNKL